MKNVFRKRFLELSMVVVRKRENIKNGGKRKMKKKILATLLAATMVVGLTACGGSKEATATTDSTSAAATEATETTEETTETAEAVDYGSGSITIWAPEATVDFTTEMVSAFFEANPDMAGYTFTVEPVGEGDAAGNMITDVEGGADLFNFAQDQIARLVSAGALSPVMGENADFVSTQNDAGAVGAATVGDMIYAYPLTSDNGYFLYYDKSVVTDPSSLEAILADCEAAGKNFYFELNSGWYQTAFFFATGCDLTFDTDSDGNFTAANVSYDSDAGVVALKEMIEVASSSSFQNGSSVDNGVNIGAIVDGTWDSAPAQAAFGDNYACAKLPSFVGSDGNTYQLSGFGGFKLLGVKPQEDAGKLAVCNALAKYLTSAEIQQARYEAVGWGPSNLTAQGSDAVKADPALSALAEQLAFTIPQGNYPGDYWNDATALGDDVVATGVLTASSSDDEIKAALKTFQDKMYTYIQ